VLCAKFASIEEMAIPVTMKKTVALIVEKMIVMSEEIAMIKNNHRRKWEKSESPKNPAGRAAATAKALAQSTRTRRSNNQGREDQIPQEKQSEDRLIALGIAPAVQWHTPFWRSRRHWRNSGRTGDHESSLTHAGHFRKGPLCQPLRRTKRLFHPPFVPLVGCRARIVPPS
jgi:hypothetical protein